MNILITGASGFIGANLLKSLENNPKYVNDKIILLASKEIEGYLCIIHNNYKFTKEDFYKKGINMIDIIIHLGAFTPKSSLESNDIDRSISNINNTEYLLQNLPNVPKKFVFISTIDVYGIVNGIISEDSPTVPNTLYGLSKLFLEKMIFEWAKNNKVILQILRIGHIYGEGEDEYKKILPMSINKILKNEAPVIYTDGKEKRTFLYIADCCNFILNSIVLDEYLGPINIVGNRTITILDLINLIIEISEKNITPKVENMNIEVKDFVFDNNKMNKYLGMEATLLEEGIKREYKYFENK